MIHVLVTVTVSDFDAFWHGFQTRGMPLRRRHGSTLARILRHAEDPAKVSILFDWESVERFRGFMDDPEVEASMREGGTVGPPEVVLLESVGELSA